MTMESIGRIRIDRHETGRYGTFGVLSHTVGLRDRPGVLRTYSFQTLEPPVSSEVALGRYPAIPAGLYSAIPYNSKKFGPTWIFLGTEPRTGILFHAGNYWLRPDGSRVTRGCILIGLRRGELQGIPSILDSRVAFRTFLDSVRMYTKLVVEVRDLFGEELNKEGRE